MSPRPKRGEDITPLQVRLPATLIKRAKHLSVEEDIPLSVLVERAVQEYIERQTKK